MDKKKVWIINHYAIPPSLGGLCRHYYFKKYVGKEDFDIRIITSSVIHNSDIDMCENGRFITRKTVDGEEYCFVKGSKYKGNSIKRIINFFDFARKIKKLPKALQEKPDIIYTSSPDIFTAYYAEKLAKKLKVPCIVEIRDLWPLSVVEYTSISAKNPIIKILYGVEKKIYLRADAVVFTMEGGKDYLSEKKWKDKMDFTKVYNVNNGVDRELQAAQREEFVPDDAADYQSNKFKVFYAGSIRTANGVDVLLKAAQILKDRNDIEFTIIGDGGKKAELIDFADKNNLNNVKFKGHVDKKYIPFICACADLNVIIVRKTGVLKYGVSWNKEFDYMFAGKPTLASVKPAYDLLERYGCGLSSESGTAEELAEKILYFYNMPKEEYASVCEKAVAAAADFDYKILADKFKNIVCDVLDKKGKQDAIH